MKHKVLLIVLAFLCSFVIQAQTNTEPPKEDPLKLQVKLFEVKHKTPSVLAEAVGALGSGRDKTRLDPNNSLKTITVRDLPENIAAIEAALKRLDVPDPAPVSIQTQIYVISASDEASNDSSPFPKELEPVLVQLKATLKYKHYRFENTYLNRVNDGGSIESNGTWRASANASQPNFSTYRMQQVRLATDNQGKEAIRIGRFNFGMRVPVQMTSGANSSIQYQDIGINTELSLSEGGLYVVGTTNMASSDGAVIVVVSAKKVK
ncbi:MAG TPA: secretin N-terminal domain-containing protein [Blastocatellia bacterium]|nr:secretin N-terminal domain-containing protein [Blastocatellia bacterium]